MHLQDNMLLFFPWLFLHCNCNCIRPITAEYELLTVLYFGNEITNLVSTISSGFGHILLWHRSFDDRLINKNKNIENRCNKQMTNWEMKDVILSLTLLIFLWITFGSLPHTFTEYFVWCMWSIAIFRTISFLRNQIEERRKKRTYKTGTRQRWQR